MREIAHGYSKDMLQEDGRGAADSFYDVLTTIRSRMFDTMSAGLMGSGT